MMKSEPAFKAKLKAGHALSEAFGPRAAEAIDEGERELAEFTNILQNRFGVVVRRPGETLKQLLCSCSKPQPQLLVTQNSSFHQVLSQISCCNTPGIVLGLPFLMLCSEVL